MSAGPVLLRLSADPTPALEAMGDALGRLRELAAAVVEECEACGDVGQDVYPTPCEELASCQLCRDAHQRGCTVCRQIEREDAAADLAEDDALDMDRCGL